MTFERSYTRGCKGDGQVRVRQDFTMPTKVLSLHLVWGKCSRGVDVRLTDLQDLEACAAVLRQAAVEVREFAREVEAEEKRRQERFEQENGEAAAGVEYAGLPAYCYRDVK